MEVRSYLKNKTPIIKWIRPVRVRKVPLLMDVYAMIITAKETDLAFDQVDQMNPDEYLAWMIYGGYRSYQLLHNKRPSIEIEDCLEIVDGLFQDQRLAVLRTIQLSKEIGKLMDSYQKARQRLAGEDPDSEDKKKEAGQG